MSMDRRLFVKHAAWIGAGALLPALSAAQEQQTRLVVLHTNDVHSRLDPFPMDGSRNQGLGGVAARAAMIEEIRKAEQHVLLLDAGDIFQGTPYFNMYMGEPEMKAMSLMRYDACTMGNHDFDGGLENFATQLQHANFPVIVSNYRFAQTPLENRILPYKVIKRGPLTIGIYGLGIELQGLVPENLYGNTVYHDPVALAKQTEEELKRRKRCDFIICLSHLGYRYTENKISDVQLAPHTSYTDLIIGGHTHTFLSAPVVVRNAKNKEVVINQVGWGGINLGRLDFVFDDVGNAKSRSSRVVTIEKKTLM